MDTFSSLPRSFYEPSAGVVAPKLLGHWLIRNTPAGPCGGPIVETEAYVTGDAASHSFNGQTKRNRAMWGAPGHGYVYFIYGNHWCFNTVCHRVGVAEGVLIRAIEPIFGVEQMRDRRRVTNDRELTNGPGKLCAALDIDRGLDGLDICDEKAPLFIAKNPALKTYLKQSGGITTTTRIGITKAAALPLRFYLSANESVSRRQPTGKRKSGRSKTI